LESPAIYIPSSDGPLRQGEILSGIVQVRLKLSPDGNLPSQNEPVEFQRVSHRFALIVSQDCELDWDFKARNHVQFEGQEVSLEKVVPNVLFGRVVLADALRGDIKKTEFWKRIQQNKDERYHFLEKVAAECDLQQTGVPELSIDFKQYFTIPTDEIYARIAIGEVQRRCRLTDPYLQHLSTRFFYFQNRVALPREHESEPVQR
jgi:hypothetical protein